MYFCLVRVDREAFFELRTSCTTTTGHPYKLFKQQSSIPFRSNFLAERIINARNGLPVDQIDNVRYSTGIVLTAS